MKKKAFSLFVTLAILGVNCSNIPTNSNSVQKFTTDPEIIKIKQDVERIA